MRKNRGKIILAKVFLAFAAVLSCAIMPTIVWGATNDNGVVVLDGENRIHFTYKEGLPSSSIRIFAEGKNGDIYIGTTAGVCYADSDIVLHIINDKRINEERVLKLVSDQTGKIYGQTKNGIIFLIEDHKVSEIYESSELGLGKISTILADPLNDGKVYLGTESSGIYYGDFGANADRMKYLSAAPIDNVHWLSYDCGRVWAASASVVGYLDNGRFKALNDIPMNSAIEMMTSDYQGNMWFASSTQGVMKVVTNSFVDLSGKAGLAEAVTNATCLYKGRLYIGTDEGLRIVDEKEQRIEDRLTKFIGNSRVRHISEDADGNLWISVYTGDHGAVCLTNSGEIKNYTVSDGLPGNEVRCCVPAADKSVLVGNERRSCNY